MTDPILIVDDDHSMRRLIAAALALAGHRTAEAASGAEALELLRHHRFAAVLLDSRMPEMSGLEVLVAIRARLDGRTLPILLVTGDDEVVDRVRGLQAGADDYVVKPFHPDELIARVHAQLRGHAAWAETVERQLRERSAVAAALCRMGADDAPETTAERVCTELRALRGMGGAAVVAFFDRALAVPLVVQQVDTWGMQPGEPLPATLGRYLERRAADGPWIERGDSPGAAVVDLSTRTRHPTACAPLEHDGECYGLLVLTTPPPDDGGAEGDPRAALAAAIDFATVVSGLLGPDRLRQGSYRLGSALDDILRRRAYSSVFQPIVELRGARVIGFEALTRFEDGTPPSMRFAEATALERGIELETATLRAALGASLALPNATWLSVNVSPPLVLAEEVLDEAVQTAGRPLVLELTEHEPVDDYLALRRAIERLGHGVRLSVDDAGSGFASLRHMLALRPAFVKLDYSWVNDIHDDPARQALVAGLVHFARQTGAVLVAEGIETDEELAALRSLAVDLGQGFLFGTPQPIPAPGAL